MEWRSFTAFLSNDPHSCYDQLPVCFRFTFCSPLV